MQHRIVVVVVVIGAVLALGCAAVANANPPLTGGAARSAIRHYIAQGEAAGYTTGGAINSCRRRTPHHVGCSVTEYNVQGVDVDGARYELQEVTHGISVIEHGGELRLYDSLFGRVK